MRRVVLRFDTEEAMNAALARGKQFFYSKALILRRWKEGIDMAEELKHIPVWIPLPNLPLEMWGVQSLSKIASRVGDPLHTDEMTAKKRKLEYARILVRRLERNCLNPSLSAVYCLIK